MTRFLVTRRWNSGRAIQPQLARLWIICALFGLESLAYLLFVVLLVILSKAGLGLMTLRSLYPCPSNGDSAVGDRSQFLERALCSVEIVRCASTSVSRGSVGRIWQTSLPCTSINHLQIHTPGLSNSFIVSCRPDHAIAQWIAIRVSPVA